MTLVCVENDTHRLQICVDDCPDNPRSWDNIGVMVCFHRRHDLGDIRAWNTEFYNSWGEWLEHEILDPNGGEDEVVVLPLYMYEHRELVINTTGFSCPWDSGQLGWIYATKEDFRNKTSYTDAELFFCDQYRIPRVGEFIDVAGVMSGEAVRILRDEVDMYNCYLSGDVYGYILERKHSCASCGNVRYDIIDSCYGFYGREGLKDIGSCLGKEYQFLFNEIMIKANML